MKYFQVKNCKIISRKNGIFYVLNFLKTFIIC